MPFTEIAGNIWVLWDLQCQGGSPLCPEGALPFPSLSITVPLPPGWTWEQGPPYYKSSQWFPSRVWGLDTSMGGQANHLSLHKALSRLLFSPDTIPYALYATFRTDTFNGPIRVPHPGWTSWTLWRLQLDLLDKILLEGVPPLEGDDHHAPLRQVLIDLRAADHEELHPLIMERLNKLEVALMHSTEPEARRALTFVVRAIQATDTKNMGRALTNIRDLMTRLTAIRQRSDWSSGTWSNMLEQRVVGETSELLGEYLLQAELTGDE